MIHRHSGKALFELTFQVMAWLLLASVLVCAACHARNTAALALNTEPARAETLGPLGGRVHGPNGSEAVLPPGALDRDTLVELVMPPVGSTPPLPARLATVGATYSLGPHDLRLAEAATISIPFDPAQVPSRTVARLYAAAVTDDVWHEVAAAYASDGRINARIPSAASFVVVVGVEPIQP